MRGGLPNNNALTWHLVQCVFGKGVPRSIAYSVSQMILDIVGDLLSEYLMPLSRLRIFVRHEANCLQSLVHPSPPYLESENQMDSKDCPGVLSLPDDTDDHVYHHPDVRDPCRPYGQVHGLDLGHILAIRRCESGTHHDRRHGFPNVLRG